MRRVFLAFVGIVLGMAAEVVLWYGADLCLFTDAWHSADSTRMVGMAVIVEGILSALGAAICIGRAIAPLPAAQNGAEVPGRGTFAVGGMPVLPIWGIFFLLAALGPFGQARNDSEMLQVMDNMPGKWGTELVDEIRRHELTQRAFGVLWLSVGSALVCTPMFLKPRIWQIAWRINGVGCGIAAAGFVVSGLSVLVCFANGLAMEGASKDLAYAGYIGVLAGAVAAVVGSVFAIWPERISHAA